MNTAMGHPAKIGFFGSKTGFWEDRAIIFSISDIFLGPNAAKIKILSIFAVPKRQFPDSTEEGSDGRETEGEMPEWSIGPHSKCGVRATVPGVRIPLSPQGTHAKAMKNPVNHAFTGFSIFSKSAKKGI